MRSKLLAVGLGALMTFGVLPAVAPRDIAEDELGSAVFQGVATVGNEPLTTQAAVEMPEVYYETTSAEGYWPVESKQESED